MHVDPADWDTAANAQGSDVRLQPLVTKLLGTWKEQTASLAALAKVRGQGQANEGGGRERGPQPLATRSSGRF